MGLLDIENNKKWMIAFSALEEKPKDYAYSPFYIKEITISFSH